MGKGATHTVELLSLWDVWSLLGSTEDMKVGRQMIDYWTQFTATGNPNSDAQPVWPRYAADAGEELRFGNETATASGRGQARCPLWNDVFAALAGDDWRDL